MDYQNEVDKDAFDFLSEIEEDIKAAILNGEDDISDIECDENGYGNIRDFFHEQVLDRSYSVEDAAYVIANCENEETDTGLWEGREMYDALQMCAAFSYGNDVWEEIERVIFKMIEEFEADYVVKNASGDVVATFTDEDEAEKTYDTEKGYEIEEGRGNIDELWQDYEDENIESEIETGGAEELQVLRTWVRLAMKAGTWGGYPFGSVYIDARCGTGYSMPDIKDFNDFDIAARRKLPSMVGSYISAVEDRIEELEGINRKPYTLTVELEAEQWGEIVNELHGVAAKMADGYNEGTGWKLTMPAKG